MGHLDELEISNRMIPAAKPRQKLDAVDHARKKLVANLEEQIELARLAIEGEPLQLRRKRGHNVVTVSPRIWWRKEPEGTYFTQIRYNKMPLNLAGRGTSIEVGPLNKLPSIYRTVINAINAGELDQAIEASKQVANRK